jgi:formylglycine-generating enzyme required for sulfatase activity
MEMKRVEGGTFLMGSDDTEANEAPAHVVTLDSFYMATSAVTQAEWRALMNGLSAYHKGDGFPMERVTWQEAIAFCNKLSMTEGLAPCYRKNGEYIVWNADADGYRLPTEAEWEFAAQGGNRTHYFIYSGGDDPNEVAWYKDNSNQETHEACALSPNELGLFDMSGNIYEICWDEFHEYRKDPQIAGRQARQSRDAERHVLRGGNCHGFANRCRVKSRRNGLFKGFRQDFVGFRVARNG